MYYKISQSLLNDEFSVQFEQFHVLCVYTKGDKEVSVLTGKHAAVKTSKGFSYHADTLKTDEEFWELRGRVNNAWSK